MKKIGIPVHGLFDHLFGLALIILPWLFDLFPHKAETWVAVATGSWILFYSLLTDYRFGVFAVFSMPSHLLFDLLTGLFLSTSPWLFGFAEVIWLPHVLAGSLLIGFSLLTDPGYSNRLFHSRRRKFHRPIFRTISIRNTIS